MGKSCWLEGKIFGKETKGIRKRIYPTSDHRKKLAIDRFCKYSWRG